MGTRRVIPVPVAAMVLAGGLLTAVGIAALPSQASGLRKAGNETTAIASLRTLVTAQTLFRRSDMDIDGVADYAADLTQLLAAELIDRVLASSLKQGYVYEVYAGGEPADNWCATAIPQNPGVTGRRSFFVDHSGVIRFAHADRGEIAWAGSPSIAK
ncbi:hypothetical protein ACFL59_13445 [Planctomycetota bacterium]